MEKFNNPFFAELSKIAGIETEAGYEDVVPEEDPEQEALPPELVEQPPVVEEQPPMVEEQPPVEEEQVPEEMEQAPVDPALVEGEQEVVEAPPETPNDIDAAIDQAAAEASDEAEAAIAEAKALPGNPAPNISTQLEGPVTAEQLEQMEQVAEALPEFAALAKVAALAFIENVDEETQKTASSMFDTALSSLEGYNAVTEKVASQMFDTPEAKQSLYEVETMERIANVLEYITGTEGFDKFAEEGDSFANKAKNAVDTFRSGLSDLVDKAKYNLVNIKGDIDQGRIQLAQLDNEIAKADYNFSLDRNGPGGSAIFALEDKRRALGDQVDRMVRTRNMSLGGAIAGVGAAAAGAYMGGKALHNHFADTQDDDTLEAEQPNSLDGGVHKMSNEKIYVDSMLKLASAAALVNIQAAGLDKQATEEEVQFAKLAEERFEQIAMLNPAYIGQELVKIAHELFSQDELKEVVAGEHTEEIFEKTAHMVSWSTMDDEALEKVAGAGSVSARGVGDALRNAKEQVVNIIGEAKTKTESGQERFGNKGDQGLKNLSGLDGYSVINNPSRYEVDKTASAAFEEAMMTKQAAAQANMEADAFLNHLANQGLLRERG